MKKLIFALCLTIAALGGAYSQTFSTGPSGTGTVFEFTTEHSPTCRTVVPGSQGYPYPNGTIKVLLPDLFYSPI
ncbi:hypothetical protein [Pedobacter sp. L105]|uniref:hypothetical protein n=1 Tax=Pedobacter sp. L105 TaxID=1641871 RepID=UPI00131D0842|nr:hypothetical protein [Pedobacter sp. L105]